MKRSRSEREPTIPLVEWRTIVPSPLTVLKWIAFAVLLFFFWLFVHVPIRLACRWKGCVGPSSYSPENYPFSGPPECSRCGNAIDYDD